MLDMAVSVEQTLTTLRERADRQRTAAAAHAAALRQKLIAAVASELPASLEAWLIGSLAWGGFGERSEIDVVLQGATVDEAARLELALTRATGWPVVTLRLEDLPDSFQGRIQREGVVLQGG